MPAITADFSKISHEFESLPAGTYRAVVEEIKESETKENKLPQLNFKLRVMEGDHKDGVITDFVTLKQKDGQPNTIGLGRIKAYAIAILGEEAANGGAIDTDELKGGTVEIVVKEETYEKKDGSGQGKRSNISKVLAPQ